ncbi:hypothetical protein Nepgr_004239 [Nepenthes gracilis]|uniref:FACT complex subunit SSRP1 n=1 Tax=Nepenthes gracilis TaxID=150966 RepID=A0AAD3XEZ3_NEPGR|nr:hypothetical protein Nepgr_004239 [Nepenthes gracilis]
MAEGHLFSNISLGGRSGTNPGQLRVHSGGVLWKKQGGGKAVEVQKNDIMKMYWMKVPRTNQLGIRSKDGLYYKFIGFNDQDVGTLTNFFRNNCGITPEEKQLSVSGHNWGEVDFNGNMMAFLVGSKQAFELSLADVSQTQMQGKNDVLLEFHVDDTTGANEKDSLMEISFHIPNTNTQFVGDENHPPAQVFYDKIMSMADIDAEEAIVTFEGTAILTPRGRYSVELHLSFIRLLGQASDFKIQYSSIVRLFCLPKSNQPHTFVVITLDPPIRKGHTLYPHIVMQFETDYVVESTLSMSEELLNTKYKDKLEPSYKGLIHDVFTNILRALSGAKVTRPGKFRSCLDGYAVKSSLKAEDGVLYPLEKSFFFLPKPPTLILHDEIDYVEFQRHAAGGSNMHYFDLLIRLKTEQEHLFRNIQRSEYHNLFDFISSKGLKILNLGDVQTTQGVAAVLQNDEDEAVDPHLERIRNQAVGDESDEEDEDFVVDKEDGGSPTDDSGEEESDASESGGDKKPAKKDKQDASVSKTSSKKKSGGEDDGAKKKKQKKKKDPNAPKRATTSFFYFSQAERENVKKENPGIAFLDVAKVLSNKWKSMSAEEKEPFEQKARTDKKRYKDEMGSYKNPKPTNMEIAGDQKIQVREFRVSGPVVWGFDWSFGPKRMDLKSDEGDGSVATAPMPEKAVNHCKINLRSASFSNGDDVRSTSVKNMYFRADEIDLKNLDIQLEKHLSRVWSKEREINTRNEEWEIDLSKLDIRCVIAHGTYGTVYKGVYDGQDVAVKILDWGEDGMATAAETAALRASFRQEVAVWHKLDHQNITKFIGASMGTSNLKVPSRGTSNDINNSFPSRACCVVVEYLPSGTLKNYLIRNRRKKLPLKIVVQLALDISRGLSYLHSKKIVHRDVKTENLLLSSQRMLKIADFGVARVEAQNPRDMTGETGTLGYMAPEVLDGKPYNRKCDVYSFGICLWEIYCCDMPYPDLSFADISSAVVQQNLRPEIPRCCPSSLASIMRKCWHSSPDRRPEMDEVVQLLEAIDTSKGGGMIPKDQAPGCFCFSWARGP